MRLTKRIREEITNAVLKHRFDEVDTALKKQRSELALDCYRARYTAEQLRQIKDMPEGWLPKANYIAVQFEGLRKAYTHLCFNGSISWARTESIYMPMPHKDVDNPMLLGAKHKLTKRYNALEDKQELRDSQYVEVTQSVHTLLTSVQTVKKLVETWPEVEPFIPYVAPKAAVPMVDIKRINEQLGL